MSIDLGKRQTIEEITGGRIKKKMREGQESRPVKKISVSSQKNSNRSSASR